ncbi:MAG TPA: ABC transporter ATP-binding protein [Candidatus Dormibacteraeota bacterium]|nr:ABC transporter ATP-binding protein [Candidatus Dormibacteraeota bacterium]
MNVATKAGALRIHDLVVSYGANRALDGVSLDVDAGELHAVIGPNGAGKSTLFAAVAGEVKPVSGSVTLDGTDVTTWAPHRRVRFGVARAFQVSRIFPTLTARENVLAAILCREGKASWWWSAVEPTTHERSTAALEDVGLAALAESRGDSLSQGDRKRLEIAMALQLDARLLLLDEPTAGMSPHETSATVALIESLWRRRGLTILLTEHDMSVVFRLAQRLTVMHRGRILCSGAPAEIRGRADVREVYLGHG